MHVQRVAMPGSAVESWTVLGSDDTPIEPVERYLAYLTDVERSPNAVKAYAHDLKDYWVFLAHRGLDWREVRLEDIGEFVAWLRLPLAGRSGQVVVLPAAGRSDTLFSDHAIELVHTTSRGLPRAVNNLAIQALIAAYTDRKAIVDQTSARTAVNEVTTD